MAKNRKRPGRTRTKRDNRRAPMLLSKIDPQEINVREGEVKSLVCPDCRTWRRLMGDTKLVIREHCISDKVAEGEKHVRCDGSNQVVQLDISIEQWSEAMLAADSTATGRRSARQHYKPLPAPAKPVTRMSPVSMSVADALAAYREHLKKCRSSSVAGRCGGTHRCADGARLAAVYAELERAQPLRDREARVDALLARYLSIKVWAKHSEATVGAKTAMAKRSGTAVEEANNSCRIHPADTVSEFRGSEVPLQPVRISA
ncbi:MULTISPECIES: hypothetical protein [Streptomyces]|uniref:Uncharacterized protein n=1 Tax=Streptomyces dengpaensis TaxID=2049881 RepID=A0ABM6T3Y4_9ACTN|nr:MULTISPECIES: hypothetical protein [Streptomyces]AVH61759.1 hypothetical protein C4B68_40365 [Streptomyces dengpaensis]PIB05029.1 hypothetical protein B1C81_30420 [Streptomyces sp. HG99]